jgi:signal transduction histidine kinase
VERDLKDAGLFFEREDALQVRGGGTESGLLSAAETRQMLTHISSAMQLFEWGSPFDVLEFTRGQILDELLRLRDDERQRIGQELHDSAGQLLLSLQLSVGRLALIEPEDGHIDLIEEIRETARQIGQEIRSLAFLNHPMRLTSNGLPSALKALMDGFGKRLGCRVSFKIVGDPAPSDAASSLALLRVAQEALVNIHRHAHASAVAMTLRAAGNRLELSISDNGVGMPPSDEVELRGGVGVQGMRFRVERLGGRFQIRNLKRGTKIFASVPVASAC